jgi:histidine triad (HIT) family protein
MELYDTDALMEDCIFCKIAKGEIPATLVYQDKRVIAIEDLNPQAPTHLLVMPVAHYDTIWAAVNAADDVLGASLLEVASRLGNERGGVAGYRLVVNSGPQGGQTVGHVHIHVLAGRHMTWPPG